MKYSTFLSSVVGGICLTCGIATGALITDYHYSMEPNQIITIQVPEPEVHTVLQKIEVPRIETVEIIRWVETDPEIELSYEDMEMIAAVVWHEAGNQDMIGKRLVADCIMNRMENEHFPSTVYGVIHQPNQFCCNAVYYTDDCMEAVKMECEKRLDNDVLYFRTGWYHGFGTPLFVHGAHYFSGWAE